MDQLPEPHLQRRSVRPSNKSRPECIRLQKSYRWKPPSQLSEFPDFIAFSKLAERELICQLPVTGRKIGQKRSFLCAMLYQLFYSALRGRLISDTRNTSEDSVRFRVQLWDMIQEQNWLEVTIGSRSERVQTRYSATAKLLAYLPRFQAVFGAKKLFKNTACPDQPTAQALVYGHTGKRDPTTGRRFSKLDRKRPLPLPDSDSIEFQYLYLLEGAIEEINTRNAGHDWKVRIAPQIYLTPDVALRQIHIGEWNRAPRLYTFGVFSAQSMTRAVRQTMTIDGEESVELDFTSMVPRMAYHSEKHDCHGDLYKCDEVFPELRPFADGDTAFYTFVRNVLKRATNTMLNVGARTEANRVLTYHGREYLRHSRFGHFFNDVVGIRFSDLIDRIESVHSPIRHLFYRCCGLDLMTHEALIMLLSLLDITATGRAALGIHDAIRCKASDADFVEEIMKKNYGWRFPGFIPEIRRST